MDGEKYKSHLPTCLQREILHLHLKKLFIQWISWFLVMFSNHMAVEYLLFSVCLFLGKLWKDGLWSCNSNGWTEEKKKCDIKKSAP